MNSKISIKALEINAREDANAKSVLNWNPSSLSGSCFFKPFRHFIILLIIFRVEVFFCPIRSNLTIIGISLVVGGGGGVVRFVALGGDDDERRLIGLGWVFGFTLVLDVGVEACMVVGCVCHYLCASVWKLNLVGTLYSIAVALLILTKVQTLVGVADSIGKVVWLGGLFVVFGGAVGVHRNTVDYSENAAAGNQYA